MKHLSLAGRIVTARPGTMGMPASSAADVGTVTPHIRKGE